MISEMLRTRTGDRGTETAGERASLAEGDAEADGISGVHAVALGLEGGLIATVVMTAFRMPISHSLPPTADFWAKYVGGGDPDDYVLQGILLHAAYGMGAGGVFGALIGRRETGPEIAKESRGAFWGFVFGVLLSVFGVQVVLKRLLGMDLKPDERWVFHVSHVIYGLTLGTWFGSNA